MVGSWGVRVLRGLGVGRGEALRRDGSEREWRCVALSVRVTPGMLARVDWARGGVARSEWLLRAVEAYLESGAGLVSALTDGDESRFEAARLAGDSRERLRVAMELPLPSRCTHGRRGLWCGVCGAMIGAGNWPVRLP